MTRAPVDLPDGALERAAAVRAARSTSRAAKARLGADMKAYVDSCVDLGIPVRDIAFLLGITPQRVSQIARRPC